ncbi:MAG: uracil-DNA glycosylase family protein [Anaerolineae bacterium]|nr:uracil-DNA glycosylase family protein [Anaerolineae bacterium]MDQ7035380.1 uracil-DNA glycosylase family protein [Anaerolineae bacterium]
MSRIFINYRRADSEGHVGRLYDHLVQHFRPDDIFMDISSIEPGQDFVQVLEDAVATCDIFLAIIGSRWLTLANAEGERRLDLWNDFVRIEIESALKHDKLVIPVLVGGAKMPSPDDLPATIASLSRRNAIEVSHQRFGYDVQKLIETMKSQLPAHSSFKKQADPEVIYKKQEALKDLRIELVGATDSPLYQFRNENRYFPVIGEGNPDANIFFMGEAPGHLEAEVGKPFVGQSGQLLEEWLAGVGIKREDVFLTNILLDRPPKNRDPLPEELQFYEKFADQLLDIIQPAVIVTLGRFAMQYILKKLDVPEKKGKISDQHGKLIKAQLPYGEIHVLPMFHPALALYAASKKDMIKADFEKLRLFI